MPDQIPSRSFCAAPWLAVNIGPAGDVLPCCAFSDCHTLGSLQSSELAAVRDSPAWRKLRLGMLRGETIPSCRRCDTAEEAGFPSIRQEYNRNAGAREALVSATRPDGGIGPMPAPYLDVRFSNLCNYKCRYCAPDRSTAWQADWDALAARLPGEALSGACVSQPAPRQILRQVQALVPGLKRIYFSGGEPLITPEHYELLDFLVESGRTDVHLVYSTNFSETVFRGRDVFELWNKFSRVEVGASLDAAGRRGEYIRKNQDWSRIIRNRERMLAACPGATFYLAPTLSVMNALCLPDFHREWVERGWVSPELICIGFVSDPEEFSAQVLPPALKREAAAKYQEHVLWLERRHGRSADPAAAAFMAAVNFMRAADRSALLDKFRRRTRALDALRGERLEDALPELAGLMIDGL